VLVKKMAQLPVVMTAYHIPQANTADWYPLQLVETLLLSGQSSRLYQRLVDKDQLAISVRGGTDFGFDPGLFEFNVQPKKGVDTGAIEKALNEELQRLSTTPVSEEELQKAKNIVLADFYRGMKTINGRANLLGRYEVFFGDYHRLFSEAGEYKNLTAADVQRVAAQYFTDNNRTVAILVPEAPAANSAQQEKAK